MSSISIPLSVMYIVKTNIGVLLLEFGNQVG